MKTTITTLLIIVFASAYSQVPIAGLVAYYPFNGNANDESGNNYNGTVIGATLTMDRFNLPNSAYNFNGTNNYIDLSNHISSLNFSAPASFSFWVQTKYDLPMTVFSTYNGVSSDIGSVIYLCEDVTSVLTNELITVFQKSNPSDFYVVGLETLNRSLIINSGWHHVAVVYNDTLTKVYLDNSLINLSGNWGINNGHYGNLSIATKASIGARYNNGYGVFFNGILDDIRIYNVALTSAQVDTLYHETITSISNNSGNLCKIDIYPNPTHDYVFINAKNLPNKSKYSITILNSIGQSVYQSSINQHKTQINIHELGESGIYFFKIVNENGDLISIQKIVLQ